MRRTTLFAALAAAVAALVLAACGSSDDTQKLAQDVSGGKADAGQSLYEADNLSKALDAVKAKVGDGAKVSSLKIEPKSVKATVVAGGQPKVLAGNLDGTVITLNVPTDIGENFGSVDLGALDTAAPQKIIDGLKAEGATEDTVDYMVLAGDPITKKVKWTIFLSGGKGPFQANLDGSDAKSLTAAATAEAGGTSSGGSSSGTSSSGSSSSGGSGVSVPDPAKVQACIAKAGTDATKIAACATGG